MTRPVAVWFDRARLRLSLKLKLKLSHRNGGTVNAEDAAENGAVEEEEKEEETNAHPGCQLVVGHFSSVQWLQLTNVDSGDNVDKLQVQAIDID
ncbi:hypothetical protein ACLKA7_000331 [Drosophila subpalustris]